MESTPTCVTLYYTILFTVMVQAEGNQIPQQRDFQSCGLPCKRCICMVNWSHPLGWQNWILRNMKTRSTRCKRPTCYEWLVTFWFHRHVLFFQRSHSCPVTINSRMIGDLWGLCSMFPLLFYWCRDAWIMLPLFCQCLSWGSMPATFMHCLLYTSPSPRDA